MTAIIVGNETCSFGEIEDVSPWALNDAGHIAGTFKCLVAQDSKPFVWYGSGPLEEMPLPAGATVFSAGDMNSSGHVVGSMSFANDGLGFLAFRFDGTETDALGVLPFGNSSVARSINDAGIIVGFSTNTVGHHVPGVEPDYLPPTAVMWRNGEIEDLGLDALSSRAEDVNELGQIVGAHLPEGTGLGVAFLKVIDGPWQSLGPGPGGVTSDARAINNRGQIVGIIRTIDHARRPFLWERGEMTMLEALPGEKRADPRDINDDGLSVGSSWEPGDHKAVLRRSSPTTPASATSPSAGLSPSERSLMSASSTADSTTTR